MNKTTRKTNRKSAKVIDTNMTTEVAEIIEVEPTAAEIADLEAALAGLDDDVEGAAEIIEEMPSAAAVEAAVQEIEMEEAKSEIYEKQEAAELSAEPVEKKETKKSVVTPRKTMTGSKKSEVVLEKLGGNSAEFFALEIADAGLDEKGLLAKRADTLAKIDAMAKKVGEKAVNLIDFINSGKKLSAYTEIALRLLIEKGEMSTKDLVEKYQARPYSIGTSRSQAHQMFKLFPELKVGIMDGKTMKLNPDSLIVAKAQAMFATPAPEEKAEEKKAA
jgi:hypothetical protein